MIKNLLLLVLLVFLGLRCQAQNERIMEGRVVSPGDGQPLAGVNVVVKGTTLGTSTDADGRYAIAVHDRDVLVFSFIGYATMEFAVVGLARLDVKLAEDISTLKEVTIVSTGYEQLPKERSTGSFVQVDNNLLNRRVSTDVIARIEDVSSGVIFNRNPGSTPNDISIRGVSTIFSNAKPLIVIDNFPYDGDINTINPNDVETITILKDAAAASIWGARAGNGVIVITTKKGKRNQAMKASFNSNVTIADKPDLFYASRMSSSDFIDVEKGLFDQGYYASAESSGNHAPITPAVELMIANRDGVLNDQELNVALTDLRKKDVRNDFSKYFYRRAVKQQYAVNVNGGTAVSKYFISAGWDKNLDNLVRNEYNRVTFTANNTFVAMKEKLEFNTALYYSASDQQTPNGGSDALRFGGVAPLYPYASFNEGGKNVAIIKDYRGNFVDDAEQQGLLNWQYKPIDELYNNNQHTKLTDYRINARMSYAITRHLKAEVLYQYWRGDNVNRKLNNQKSYYSRNLINQYSQIDGDGNIVRPIPLGGVLDMVNQLSLSNSLRSQITYAREFGDHDVSALGGYEVREVNTNGSSFRYYGYDDDLATNGYVDYETFYPRYDNDGSFAQIPNSDALWSYTDRFVSYFGNASYAYKHRYTLSGSVRKDQSNLFGVKANQRGVPLWSTGIAWNIGEESFFRSDAISFLKIRATYGYNGNINKNVTAFTTARRIGYADFTGLPYATITNPPNANLRWERVKVVNLGVDFRLKNDVITGSVEYFSKQGLDLIGSTPMAPSTGITSFTGNTANTKGRGLDIVLNSVNINRTLKWNTNFLFSYIKEKVTRYKESSQATTYLLYGNGVSETPIPLEGKPLYGVYSYAWAGLDPETGDPRSYVDGKPSSDYAAIATLATPQSIIYNGSARPQVFGSVRNTIAWKNISLSFNLTYRLGYYFRRNSVTYANVLTGQVDHGDYALRWQQKGDEKRTDVPSMPQSIDYNRDNIYLYSTVLVEKGDHIRFQDVNLSYTLDRKNFIKLPVERVHVYCYVNNIGIVWKATKTSLDPDYMMTKPVRSLAVGVRVEF